MIEIANYQCKARHPPRPGSSTFAR